MLTVLDLFSGIGGFSLGFERAGMKTISFCENNAFCRRVLAKHWPGVPIVEDVTTASFPDADIIVGGFPCQDISVAGDGAGLAGARSGLWEHLLRAIRLVRPRHAVVENVAALLGRGLGKVVSDLAEIGYDAEWHCIPACAVGAEHERDRVWIVAHADRSRLPERLQAGENQPNARAIEPWLRSALKTTPPLSRDYWDHQPVLGRGIHGVSDRVDRVSTLGNSVVPQIPEIIARAILSKEAATNV